MLRNDDMNRAVDGLRLQVRELDSAYVTHTAAVREAIRLANLAIDVLDGELRDAVNGAGGVHGTAERAWAAWVDLAIDTEQNLQAAAGYASAYSLSGWLKKGLATATDAAANFNAGLTGTLSLVVWGIVALVALQALQLVPRRGRA